MYHHWEWFSAWGELEGSMMEELISFSHMSTACSVVGCWWDQTEHAMNFCLSPSFIQVLVSIHFPFFFHYTFFQPPFIAFAINLNPWQVVLVLACEGSELKGYKRKQGNSKNMMKHMRNGGRNSFNFHSSPRMVGFSKKGCIFMTFNAIVLHFKRIWLCHYLLQIPHIFKPEVQFVEFSIEQFVHRGKKVIDDNTIQTPVIADKLTVAETTLIAKYFDPHEITWKPSLIAFPHFQTYPSRVYKVMHSHRTTMLIDMMQCLQGLTFSRDSNISLLEVWFNLCGWVVCLAVLYDIFLCYYSMLSGWNMFKEVLGSWHCWTTWQ